MKLSKNLVKKLLEKYDVGSVESFSKLREGYMNDTFEVNCSNGRYVLRIGNESKGTKDRIFEIDFLDFLNIKTVKIPKFIIDKKGNYLNNFNGRDYGVYKYIEGSMPKKITKRILKQIAGFLGELHSQSEEYIHSEDRFSWYTFDEERSYEFSDYWKSRNKNHHQEINWLRNAVMRLKLPDSLPQGVIHCDVKRNNLLEHNGKLSGVVDFDNCQIGPFLLDLAITITWTCTNWKNIDDLEWKILDYSRLKMFLRTYQKYRILSSQEKEYLFQAIRYAYAVHLFVDFYVNARKMIPTDYLNFKRKYFLKAAKNIKKNEFDKCIRKNSFYDKIFWKSYFISFLSGCVVAIFLSLLNFTELSRSSDYAMLYICFVIISLCFFFGFGLIAEAIFHLRK
jgi:homoserine kinase type II